MHFCLPKQDGHLSIACSLNEETERNAYQQYKQQVNREARFTFGDLLKKHKNS